MPSLLPERVAPTDPGSGEHSQPAASAVGLLDEPVLVPETLDVLGRRQREGGAGVADDRNDLRGGSGLGAADAVADAGLGADAVETLLVRDAASRLGAGNLER